MRVRGTVPTADGFVDVGDDLRVPRTITVKAEGVDGYRVDMSAEYQPDSGRYECRSLTVESESGGEVTGDVLRSIPVLSVLNAGVSSALQGFTLLSRGPLPKDLGKHGPTDEALTWVAYLYRMALIFGHAPVPAIGEALGLPKSTANRWITRARDRGLLTVQDKRGQRKADE